MRANPDKELSIHMIPFLAGKHYGPSLWTIYKRCGTWSKFKAMAAEAYEKEQHEIAQKLQSYRSLISQGELPRDFTALPDEELLAAAARFRVVGDCLPKLELSQKARLAMQPSTALTALIRKRNPDITAGHIEMVAASKNVFDDIWPTDNNIGTLFVPESVIEAARRLNTTKKIQDRKRRKHTAA